MVLRKTRAPPARLALPLVYPQLTGLFRKTQEDLQDLRYENRGAADLQRLRQHPAPADLPVNEPPGKRQVWQKEADAEPVRQITGLYSMRYAMRSRADATSAEACRTFQNLAIHPSCRRTPLRSASRSCSASGCKAWTAGSDNTSRFPWPSAAIGYRTRVARMSGSSTV